MSKSKGLGDDIKKVTSAVKLDILAEKVAHAIGNQIAVVLNDKRNSIKCSHTEIKNEFKRVYTI